MNDALVAEVFDFARAQVATVLASLVDAAEQAWAERRAEPHRWSVFHREMERRLPRVRWLARSWHRSMARRMAAHARAQEITSGCTGARLADALDLPG